MFLCLKIIQGCLVAREVTDSDYFWVRNVSITPMWLALGILNSNTTISYLYLYVNVYDCFCYGEIFIPCL